ncbi:hypothetical protein ACNQFZ_08685 [Schinkia sp. CFF1]
MVLPKFGTLENLSETTKAGKSDLVWREFLVANHNFINHSFHQTEDQAASITKSLQNWITRKDFMDYKEKNSDGKLTVSSVNEGDIFIADLGLSYETAYSHPVLVLENIGDKVLVLPVTSTPLKVSNAYHPSSNTTGDTNYRKVYKSDGFETESALIIDSPMVIRKGRLLERKGRINEDISAPTSIYQEVRESLFKTIFNDFYIKNQTIFKELNNLKEENDLLKSQLQK